jgi:hypothetical protein
MASLPMDDLQEMRPAQVLSSQTSGYPLETVFLAYVLLGGGSLAWNQW